MYLVSLFIVYIIILSLSLSLSLTVWQYAGYLEMFYRPR